MNLKIKLNIIQIFLIYHLDEILHFFLMILFIIGFTGLIQSTIALKHSTIIGIDYIFK